MFMVCTTGTALVMNFQRFLGSYRTTPLTTTLINALLAAVLFFVGAAIMLGSWAGVAVSGLLLVVLALRMRLEERLLRAELPGYAEYMEKVRYRLIPGVW
jgi:hypothetical protein